MYPSQSLKQKWIDWMQTKPTTHFFSNATKGMTRKKRALLLSYWNKQGWVRRIQRGFYMPIPIESDSRDVSIEDPSLAAMQLFSPCYIGGWSAAEYWDLTEQLFNMWQL